MGGVDIWEPYVEQFDLWLKYDFVAVRDACDLILPAVHTCFSRGMCSNTCDGSTPSTSSNRIEVLQAIMVSIPIVDYPQHAHDGNPYEEHLDQWTFDEMAAQFAGV